MKKSKFFLVIFPTILLLSCNKEGDETKISSYTSSESHNQGQNCMSCHKSGGDGEGWFKAAGTVYDSTKINVYPKTTVKLYSGPQGTGSVKYTVQVDGLGNFYTTEKIDFGSGLYPAVEGNNQTKYMSNPITNGACNSCHGVSTDKIWTK